MVLTPFAPRASQLGGHRVYASLPGRLLVIGFGSIGAGVLPLLLRHVAVAAERVTLLTAADREAEARAAAQRHGFAAVVVALTPDNYRQARARTHARPRQARQPATALLPD